MGMSSLPEPSRGCRHGSVQDESKDGSACVVYEDLEEVQECKGRRGAGEKGRKREREKGRNAMVESVVSSPDA